MDESSNDAIANTALESALAELRMEQGCYFSFFPPRKPLASTLGLLFLSGSAYWLGAFALDFLPSSKPLAQADKSNIAWLAAEVTFCFYAVYFGTYSNQQDKLIACLKSVFRDSEAILLSAVSRKENDLPLAELDFCEMISEFSAPSWNTYIVRSLLALGLIPPLMHIADDTGRALVIAAVVPGLVGHLVALNRFSDDAGREIRPLLRWIGILHKAYAVAIAGPASKAPPGSPVAEK